LRALFIAQLRVRAPRCFLEFTPTRCCAAGCAHLLRFAGRAFRFTLVSARALPSIFIHAFCRVCAARPAGSPAFRWFWFLSWHVRFNGADRRRTRLRLFARPSSYSIGIPFSSRYGGFDMYIAACTSISRGGAGAARIGTPSGISPACLYSSAVPQNMHTLRAFRHLLTFLVDNAHTPAATCCLAKRCRSV
jgi:hypothetical protein